MRAAPRPAHKAIINRCRRTILGRAITPATAAFQHMHNTADHAAIIRPLDPAYICRQMRFDPLPLLIAKPKQVPGHDPNPLPKTNQDRIVRAEKLMSSDPRIINLPATCASEGAREGLRTFGIGTLVWCCRFESWQVERLRCISGAMVLSRAQHSPLRRPEAGLPETSSCP